ncbi:MAG: hypothetical protein WD273_05585 [Trueperaceae bacterium]
MRSMKVRKARPDVARGAFALLPRTLCLVTLSLIIAVSHAQPSPTLDLSFSGDVYLSDVSRGLEGQTDYRQSFRTIRFGPDTEEAEAKPEFEWLNEVSASGDRHVAEHYAAQIGLRRDSFLIGGQAYLIGQMEGEEATCMMPPSFFEIPPTITVANMTGFHSAQLVSDSEVVNGKATARYRLDPPTNARFEEGSLQGELWLALDGGYLVSYRIEGRMGEETTRWEYDLTPLDEIAAPDCDPAQ